MSFPPGTEIFQFPGFALKPLCIQGKSTWFYPLMIARNAAQPASDQGSARSVRCEATTIECQVGSPIRRSLDQSLFPAPQSLTQGITSFIASCCLGIHQTPFSRLI